MARSWYGRRSSWGGYGWRPYVSVSERRAQAARKISSMKKKGHRVEPVEIEGRTIARTFWGRSWCENLERYSDFENRLPRGRTYVRNGSVIDLQITRGRAAALVSGSEIYEISIDFVPLEKKRWGAIKNACAGKIDSVVELLKGQLSQGVMEILTARETGLFPAPKEIKMHCSCPDWATMCKHVAAVLYGVGARLDARPELLFVLRGVDQSELVTEAAAGAVLLGAGPAEAMDSSEMEKLFGIEIDEEAAGPAPKRRQRGRVAARAAGAPAAKAAEGPPSPLPRKKHEASVLPARDLGGLEERVPLLRRHFTQEDTLTRSDYRRLFSVTPVVASRELAKLAGMTILIRRGRKRGTHYLAGVEIGPR